MQFQCDEDKPKEEKEIQDKVNIRLMFGNREIIYNNCTNSINKIKDRFENQEKRKLEALKTLNIIGQEKR